jgi:putative ABC transport system ATP-binding protein
MDHKSFSKLFEPPSTQGRPCAVRAVDVKKVFKMGDTETHALRGATLDIYRGEYISIMGPSGSGKTTFFNAIGALAKPTSGKVYIDQVDVAQLGKEELAWLRCRKIGYIFQSYHLIRVMTCLENVTLSMSFAGMDGEQAASWALPLRLSPALPTRRSKTSLVASSSPSRLAIEKGKWSSRDSRP